jgi:very-long-chain enoyl-CoA reductase
VIKLFLISRKQSSGRVPLLVSLTIQILFFKAKKKFDVNRMRITLGDAKGKAMSDRKISLSKFFTPEDLKGSDPVVLVFKDLGLQISWKLVFLIEYFGPMLITALFVVFQKQIYGQTFKYNFSQKIGLTMIFVHYMKRELETLFVHRFSNDTMPFFNVFKNSFHYWILLGVGAMYFVLHPLYTSPAWASDTIHMALFGLFCFFEFMNFNCHMVLRNLRKPGSSERGIPKGFGFDLVSCANYFWESLCWLTFSISTQCFGAYFFTLFSFA